MWKTRKIPAPTVERPTITFLPNGPSGFFRMLRPETHDALLLELATLRQAVIDREAEIAALRLSGPPLRTTEATNRTRAE